MRRQASSFIISFFFVLLLLGASALSIESEQEEYFKGEEIVITGSCDSETVLIAFLNATRDVVEETVDCEENAFSYSYQTSFLDPAGPWWLNALAIKPIKYSMEDAQTRIRVKPVRDSEYYLIRFLSPSERTIARYTDTDISVRVTDAEENVDGAKVVAWDAQGEKLELTALGAGKYGAQYSIPIDTSLEEWGIIVTAEKDINGVVRGGEARVDVSIGNMPIEIEIVKPDTKNFEIGNTVALEIKASYFNGKPLQGAIAKVSFRKKESDMQGAGSTFTHNIELDKDDIGAKKIVVLVMDRFGNSKSTEFDIIIGESLFSKVIEAAPFAIITLVILAAVFFLVLPQRKKSTKISGLGKRKKSLEKDIEKLQEEYFEEGKWGVEAYNKRIGELEAELSEVKKQLKIR